MITFFARRTPLRRLGASLVMSVALSGCHIRLLDLGPMPALYDISPSVHFDKQIAPVNWQLVVNELSAANALNTDRILVRPAANEIKYFAGTRWAERVPSLVQSQFIKAFEKSGVITGVGRRAIGLRGDYDLQGELGAFDTLYSDGGTPTIDVALNLKILRQPSGQIIAARSFEQKERARDGAMPSIAASYERALSQILSDAVPWTLTEAQKDYEQRGATRAGTR